MIGTIDLENMEPNERAAALIDYFSGHGEITIDKVRFVAGLPKAEAKKLAERLLETCGTSLSGNAKAFLLRVAGQYRGKQGPARPYSHD